MRNWLADPCPQCGETALYDIPNPEEAYELEDAIPHDTAQHMRAMARTLRPVKCDVCLWWGRLMDVPGVAS